MNNIELKRNAEGYADTTAAATLNKQEPGDIWTYDDGLCLIVKSHGHFSTILVLVDNCLGSSDIRIETTQGDKYTDPRRLSYGKGYKMRRYVETLDPDAFEYVTSIISETLGIEVPCKKSTLQDLSEFEAQVQALTAHRDELQKKNDFLREQLDTMTGLHEKAVDRVNKVTFAKMKVENQLELLQSMVGNMLASFQLATEEG